MRCARGVAPAPQVPALAMLVGIVLGMLAMLPTSARDLHVGPERALRTPSEAARIARDGDRVLIDAGEYRGDVAVWLANGLRIQALGGSVLLRADGAHAEGKAIWVIKGRDTLVDGIAFEGATVPHGNGAGIRHEGLGLTVRRSRFEHNEMGLLSHNDGRDRILIEQSEFAHNGPGPRHNHNLYIGRAAELIVRASYLHHARIGHNLKSRAAVTQVLYSRITDEADGYGSYMVDLPNGGDALLLGNLIQQGPFTENRALVSFGAEGNHHAHSRLRMVHNTLVNDAPAGLFVHVHPGDFEMLLVNNLLAGPGHAYEGIARDAARDVRVADFPFVSRETFDYRLLDDPRLVDAALPLPDGVPAPQREYRHAARDTSRPVSGAAPDVGALERRDRL